MIFDHHNFLSQKCYACGCDQVAEKRIYELLETEYISFCSRFFGIEFISSGRLCPSCYIYLHQLATVGSKVPNLTIINCPDTHMPTHMPNFRMRWTVSFIEILFTKNSNFVKKCNLGQKC